MDLNKTKCMTIVLDKPNRRDLILILTVMWFFLRDYGGKAKITHSVSLSGEISDNQSLCYTKYYRISP